VPLLFAVTLFASASLLFMVQPMVGRMVLPRLGGSPAVWNACMVFFQALLLVGYLYADRITNKLEAKRTQLAITISRREEDREVLVTVRFDFRAGRVTEVRNDTGEEILARHLTDEERQRNLPGLAPPPEAR